MNAIRHMVSGSNQRFIEDGVDLDLTYITPRIIAMGYPSSGIESSYRNPATVVSRFLDNRHHGHFKVFNLSERTYHDSLFSGPVAFFPFPDHHSPRFHLLLSVLESMHEWYTADEENVIVVHCIAGHGRTGTVICAFLMFEGIEPTSTSALDCFAKMRSKTNKGVEHPSQKRYVKYAEQHLALCSPETKYKVTSDVPMRIKRVVFENILKKKKERKLQVIIVDDQWDPVFNSSWTEQETLTNADLVDVSPDVIVQSDFTVKLFFVDGITGKPKELLRTSMNTRFLPENRVVLSQMELDGPHKDHTNETYEPGMQVVIELERIE